MKKRKQLIAASALALLLAACSGEEQKPPQVETPTEQEESLLSLSEREQLSKLILDKDTLAYALNYVGKPVSDFALFNIAGDTVKPSDFKGQDFLMEFALTTCPACQSLQPTLMELDVPVLQVFDTDEQANVEAFAAEFNVGEEGQKNMLFGDPRKNLSKLYNLQFVPTIFFVNAEGIIRFVSVGAEPKENLEAYMNFAFKTDKEES